MAKGTPSRPSVIEPQLGTRYTVDTLKKLVRRYPKRRFIWIMGADNLLQFHHWRQWRDIARLMPIAVIARPGYDDAAHAAVAMGWLGRFVRPASHKTQWTDWRPPALVHLRFRPDPRSATLLRQDRSAERRVGKECVGTCRSRCAPDHSKNKKEKVQTNEQNTKNTRK